MRIVITVPDLPAKGTEAADLIRGQVIPDLTAVANSIADEIPVLQPGHYGYATDPETHAVRIHWAIRDEKG